jgi:hypothetical protein
MPRGLLTALTAAAVVLAAQSPSVAATTKSKTKAEQPQYLEAASIPSSKPADKSKAPAGTTKAKDDKSKPKQ